MVGKSRFYRPEDGVCGDIIPFYEDGWYYLFYLKDFRDPKMHGEGCPWYGLRSGDLKEWEELGEMIPRGKRDEQDLFVYTGSVFHDVMGDGGYHIFYTGHNPYIAEQGRPQEVILHAAGGCLTEWKKQEGDCFPAPEGYEPNDWRDPYVFWDEQEGRYGMVLTARKRDGDAKGRGVTVLCHSGDLRSWAKTADLWEPARYVTQECPDLFRMGDRWYLIFSEFSDRFRTHYVMARSPRGPWTVPEDDVFDSRAYYAAKSVWDGRRRYLFGWLATREGDSDGGNWQWGGSLVVHELYRREDGTLAVRMPETYGDGFGVLDANVERMAGEREESGKESGIFALDGRSRQDRKVFGEIPRNCTISCSIRFDEAYGEAALEFPGDDSLPEGYQVLFLPAERKMAVKAGNRTYPDSDFCGVERVVGLEPGYGHRVRMLLEDDIMVLYLDDTWAMSTRLYRRGQGKGSFECYGMKAEVSEVFIRVPDNE